MTKRRIFAGDRLRKLRNGRNLKQPDMAALLGISVSYLSQLEHDDRPLTPVLLEALARQFPLDWQEYDDDAATRRFAALREATADPLFAMPLSPDQITRVAEQQPALADQFIALHSAYRHVGERLQIVDEAMADDNVGGGRLPWEEVRDWFHLAGNYVDTLEPACRKPKVSACPPARRARAARRYFQRYQTCRLAHRVRPAIAICRPCQLCCGCIVDALCPLSRRGPQFATRYRPASAIFRGQF
jgi:transcriptional regulator with XRE-family HTH domain